MTDRDRLIKIILEAIHNEFIDLTTYDITAIADHLLANDVFLLPEDLRGTQDFSISAFIEAMQMYKEKDLYIKTPCKVGDIVYILEDKCKHSGEKNEPWNSCNQYWDNVYKNGMWGCAGKDKKGNKIYCKQKEMVRYIKEAEYSFLLYSDPTKVLGENLFLTKEEAEKKLKELG